MRECIDVMVDALSALEQGEIAQPLRSMYWPPSGSILSWMPAVRNLPESAVGMKVLCVVPENPARGLDRHQGLVILLDGETGRPRLVAGAMAITATRTAAVSALATELLARPEASELAIVGAGVQAGKHLESIALIRDIRRARVASRSPESARAFADRVGPTCRFPVEAFESVEEAVRDADIVVTATSSQEPVLERSWLAPGTHVNSVGASVATSREIDVATLASASVFVDRRESVENEAGEYALALAEEAVAADHIKGELGELLTGKKQGRQTPEELTLFRSLGLAAEDLATAEHLLRKAELTGTGSVVDF